MLNRTVINRTLRVAAMLLVPAIALTFSAPANAAPSKKLIVSSGAIHVGIPDTGAGTKALVVKKAGTITDVNVIIAAEHPAVSDLTFLLRSPKGKVIHLSSGNGGDANGYGTTDSSTGCTQTMSFNDQAADDVANYEGVDHVFSGGYKPESWDEFNPGHSLDSLDGLNMKGKWQLIATDTTELAGGELACFKLNIKYTPIG
jgi:subtilisin-like proprotein convertase family protein